MLKPVPGGQLTPWRSARMAGALRVAASACDPFGSGRFPRRRRAGRCPWVSTGVNSVTFDSSGQSILAAGAGGEVWAFDLASGRKVKAAARAAYGTFYPPERLTAQVSRQQDLARGRK